MSGVRALATLLPVFIVTSVLFTSAAASSPPALQSGLVPSEYVVIFLQHLSPLQRHSLLQPCMPSSDLWRLSRQHFLHQSDHVSSDLAAVVFDTTLGLNAESAAVACVAALPAVKLIQQQRWYRHAATTMSNVSVASVPSPGRKLHSIVPSRVLAAKELWDKGFKGQNVRVGIFDTGVGNAHPHFLHIEERTDWTTDNNLEDTVGHGTFTASIVMGTGNDCPGFAPEASLITFRVFSGSQVSFTSWFLDAMNHAIRRRVDVINISIGGPDWRDIPFVSKVREMSANGIIVVSAIGNDGPYRGTLNNPADQLDVIGVGGHDDQKGISRFSSRGFTLWEQSDGGSGRVKPDIVTYANDLMGSTTSGGCRSMSGTSVAAPVATGVVALLLSTVPQHDRPMVSSAVMKQVLIEGATRLSGPSISEQGAGSLDLLKSYSLLKEYKPRASAFPAQLDLTKGAGSEYMWPWFMQPLYAGAQVVWLNVTVINGLGVIGRFTDITFTPHGEDNALVVQFRHSEVLWPHNGWMGVGLAVSSKHGKASGVFKGEVSFTVIAPNGLSSVVKVPVACDVIPTPPRSQRVLWDTFHNGQYPSPFFPRDRVADSDVLDWIGDHPFNNYARLYNQILGAGMYLEILHGDWTCFDASGYGTLLLVDSEEEIADAEISKLQEDVAQGLSVTVLAEWYDVALMDTMSYTDDNTRLRFQAATGGANVPQLNKLLGKWGIELAAVSVSGNLGSAQLSSATAIRRFPEKGRLAYASMSNESPRSSFDSGNLALMGALPRQGGSGAIAVLGDSSCAEDKTGTCLEVRRSCPSHTQLHVLICFIFCFL
jgi:membrane-bound transcription factor site-1 protease